MTNLRTPAHRHSPIKMRQVEQGQIEAIGDYYYRHDQAGQVFGLIAGVPSPSYPKSQKAFWIGWVFAPHILPNGGQWHWDGNTEAPTVSPSMIYYGVWHGRIKAGYLIEET